MKKHLLVVLLAVGLLAASALLVSLSANAQVSLSISVRVGPPPLPVYPQPFAPGPGYIWTPGYWAWGEFGYYWVPGAWVLAPAVGMLWTPGYWAWNEGAYWWHPGYWGRTVGFYGGINYGYGYIGVGYVGGAWRGNAFFYNRAVSNVNVTYIHNTYNETVVNRTTGSRVSYNGGSGGTTLRATQEQMTYARERHTSPTASQVRQQQLAMNDPAQRFSANAGRPQIVATARPGAFTGPGAVRRDAQGSYAYRPAARDRSAYQERQRADESRATPMPQQREQRTPREQPMSQERPMQVEGSRPKGEARPQAHERKANQAKRKCRPNDPRCR